MSTHQSTQYFDIHINARENVQVYINSTSNNIVSFFGGGKSCNVVKGGKNSSHRMRSVLGRTADLCFYIELQIGVLERNHSSSTFWAHIKSEITIGLMKFAYVWNY